MDDKQYARISTVVYVEVGENETVEEVEKRFIDALPSGMYVTINRTSLCKEEEED